MWPYTVAASCALELSGYGYGYGYGYGMGMLEREKNKCVVGEEGLLPTCTYICVCCGLRD